MSVDTLVLSDFVLSGPVADSSSSTVLWEL